jgi:hypothetical protein
MRARYARAHAPHLELLGDVGQLRHHVGLLADGQPHALAHGARAIQRRDQRAMHRRGARAKRWVLPLREQVPVGRGVGCGHAGASSHRSDAVAGRHGLCLSGQRVCACGRVPLCACGRVHTHTRTHAHAHTHTHTHTHAHTHTHTHTHARALTQHAARSTRTSAGRWQTRGCWRRGR